MVTQTTGLSVALRATLIAWVVNRVGGGILRKPVVGKCVALEYGSAQEATQAV
jgi:hypothetical protein